MNECSSAYLSGRDALARRHMQMLRAVPRGDACAWMTAGCIVAAEAFDIGLSVWHFSTYPAKPYGMDTSVGAGQANGRGASLRLPSANYL
ncbi:hypothetical protein AWB64_02476 [Caballeronia sordidicola]|uniref:Uncharacterized protein n=1 Tax=Caballeronia sordidicola TaxID=196367 RepID=A0A158GAY2_CABSO|nr:hypothetical protein AWB64_02476 [Caballeronia sordidicola]